MKDKHKKLERLQRLGIGLKPAEEIEDSQAKKKKSRQERFAAFNVCCLFLSHDFKATPEDKKAEREKRFGKVSPETGETAVGHFCLLLTFQPRKGRSGRGRGRNNSNRGRNMGVTNGGNKRKAEPVDDETAEKRRKRGERFNK